MIQHRNNVNTVVRMMYYDFSLQFYGVSLVKETVSVCYTRNVSLDDSWDIIY